MNRKTRVRLGAVGRATAAMHLKGLRHEGLDDRAARDAVLPEAEAGAPVADVLARLRKQCLDVQYASLPGGARPGTVERVLVPLAGRPDPLAALPSGGGIELPGRTSGSTVPVDPRRPATMVVAR